VDRYPRFGPRWTRPDHQKVEIMPHVIVRSDLYDGQRRTMDAAPASGLRVFQLPENSIDVVDAGVVLRTEMAVMLTRAGATRIGTYAAADIAETLRTNPTQTRNAL
jgi:deoxyribose-phosphate aldolase